MDFEKVKNINNGLVEVIGDSCDQNLSHSSSDRLDSDDSFPAIHGLEINSNSSTGLLNVRRDNSFQPSLMEEMMKEAIDSKEKMNKNRQSSWRKDTDKSSFGFKKGFLNSSAFKTKRVTKTLSQEHAGISKVRIQATLHVLANVDCT